MIQDICVNLLPFYLWSSAIVLKMLKQFKADLHIHTCLSPCAELRMTPSAIVETACKKGLDIIAVTDHNSAENVRAARKAAEKTGLAVLAGMEVTSVEEAHILAIFNSIENALKLQDIVYKNLPSYDNLEKFENQVVVNELNEVLSFNKRPLIAAAALSAYSIVEIIHSLGGLSIASHVDREVFGIISQLGFIPPDLKFDALEISPNTSIEEAKEKFKEYSRIPWITSSDAHHLQDIGRVSTSFLIHNSTFEELCMAIKGIEGRRVIL